MEEMDRYVARSAERHRPMVGRARYFRIPVCCRTAISRGTAHRGERVKRLCYGIAGLLCAAESARAQSTAELEQQLQELKQQYAETTRAMEQRIAALENQIKTEQIEKQNAAATPKQGTVSLSGLAQEAEKGVSKGADEVGANFQGAVPSEPTYDLLREADQKIDKLQ